MQKLPETSALAKAALTIPEFVEHFSVSRAALYKQWRAGGGPPRVKVGSRTLIPTSAAMRWLDKQIQP